MSEVRLHQIDFLPGDEGYEIATGQPTELRGLHRPDIIYEELTRRFEEGNDTYDIVAGPSGRPYEIVIFNPTQTAEALIVKPSTSYSSAKKNPGNFLETALAATANPGAAYMYIGSFGNNPTGHMDKADRKYLRKTGRYTTGDGRDSQYHALESVEDMAAVAEYVKTSSRYFTADSEAGRLVLGLMAGLPKDSVAGAYLNGIDGISPAAHYTGAKLSEDLKSRIHRRGIGPGHPGELTPVNIKDVKRRVPNIYRGLGRIAHLAPLPVFLFPLDTRDKIGLTLGFRGHNDLGELATHAVLQDTRAALLQQDTTITMQFNTESAIEDIEDCKIFAKAVMDSLPEEARSRNRRLRLLIGEGTHDQHTDAPHDRTRIERHAFPDIMHSMSLVDGLVVGSRIFKLRSVEEAA
ncbi:MAG TPA: hypothetical protein VD947_02035 [Patescibacteria group bacterium]|nr:hypothetical protein [Patescibacteria group bacterium]